MPGTVALPAGSSTGCSMRCVLPAAAGPASCAKPAPAAGNKLAIVLCHVLAGA